MSLITFGYLISGLVLLVVGAEALVRGAAKLASRFGIPPLIIGLTVVAFGTSAPETAVSVQASLNGSGDIAVGNVIGSNIANILLILGISALIAPLVVSRQLIRLDVPVMIGAGLLCYGLAWNGSISRLDGILLLVALIGYTLFLVLASKRDKSGPGVDEFDTEFGPDAGDKPYAWVLQLLLILLGTGFPFKDGQMDNLDSYLKMFRSLVGQTSGLRRAGAASLDLAYVAAGRFDAFWEFGLSEWDMAAGALLIQEAGGLVSDFSGGHDFLEKGQIVAGNTKCFKAVLTTIQPHLTPSLKR